ncbi:MAG: hypothetical protein JO233_05895, partial [Candidatus Eremiobacteraeota bacterium]|nr:hypothetical protein [Candidatus Eremiobacteraeota bacterium]
IADVGGGLRRFTRDGILTTIVLKRTSDSELLSVGYGDGADPVILATSPPSIAAFRPATQTDYAITQSQPNGGQPNAVAGMDARQFLFTDATAEAIYYLRLPPSPFIGAAYTRVVAGNPNDASDTAGYRDGLLTQAKFNAPLGIAENDGIAYIADAGNRRIRRVVLPRF